MLVIPQCQGYKRWCPQLQQASIEFFGHKIVPVRVRRGKTYITYQTRSSGNGHTILTHCPLLLIGGVSQAKQGKPDCLQRVLGESLAQQEPPEMSHIVWFISLACRWADKHHHWLIEQLGLGRKEGSGSWLRIPQYLYTQAMWEVPFLPGLGIHMYPGPLMHCLPYHSCPLGALASWSASSFPLSPHAQPRPVQCQSGYHTAPTTGDHLPCCGVCNPVPYGWNGLKTVVLSQH